MIIWLSGSPTTSKMKELLATQEFKLKVQAFIKNTWADLPDLPGLAVLTLPHQNAVSFSHPVNPCTLTMKKGKNMLKRSLCRLFECTSAVNLAWDLHKLAWSANDEFPFTCQMRIGLMNMGIVVQNEVMGFFNNGCPPILQCLHADHDIKLLTNGTGTKDLSWYITLYSTKKQHATINASALLAKTYVHNHAETLHANNLKAINKKLIQQCGNTLSCEQELSTPEVISYLMGWGDCMFHTISKLSNGTLFCSCWKQHTLFLMSICVLEKPFAPVYTKLKCHLGHMKLIQCKHHKLKWQIWMRCALCLCAATQFTYLSRMKKLFPLKWYKVNCKLRTKFRNTLTVEMPLNLAVILISFLTHMTAKCCQKRHHLKGGLETLVFLIMKTQEDLVSAESYSLLDTRPCHTFLVPGFPRKVKMLKVACMKRASLLCLNHGILYKIWKIKTKLSVKHMTSFIPRHQCKFKLSLRTLLSITTVLVMPIKNLQWRKLLVHSLLQFLMDILTMVKWTLTWVFCIQWKFPRTTSTMQLIIHFQHVDYFMLMSLLTLALNVAH